MALVVESRKMLLDLGKEKLAGGYHVRALALSDDYSVAVIRPTINAFVFQKKTISCWVKRNCMSFLDTYLPNIRSRLVRAHFPPGSIRPKQVFTPGMDTERT